MLSKEQLNLLTDFRKKLHTHPELSGKEIQTASLIASYLAELKPERILGDLGGHGVAAIFDSKKPGPTILFRAELDALPIEETNDFKHRSVIHGASHKCGHDGHSSILLGLAMLLKTDPPKIGKVVLLFQPSEEDGKGAKAVLADRKFSVIQPDYVFALHNLPGFPLNEVVVKTGSFTAAVRSVAIRLEGKTSHAAEPEKGKNPASAIADIIVTAEKLTNNSPEEGDFVLLTPVHIRMGEVAYGISAGSGEIHFTIRARKQQKLDSVTEELVGHFQKIRDKHCLEISHNFTEEFQATYNDASSVQVIKKTAIENGFSVSEPEFGFKWGEDFGLFTQKYPGAMFGIGAGEEWPSLHSREYDFPDALLSTGTIMFHGINKNILKNKNLK